MSALGLFSTELTEASLSTGVCFTREGTSWPRSRYEDTHMRFFWERFTSSAAMSLSYVGLFTASSCGGRIVAIC